MTKTNDPLCARPISLLAPLSHRFPGSHETEETADASPRKGKDSRRNAIRRARMLYARLARLRYTCRARALSLGLTDPGDRD